MNYEEKLITYIKERYGIEPEHPWISYPDYSTFKDKYSDKWFALIMHVGQKKLCLNKGNGFKDNHGNNCHYIDVQFKNDNNTQFFGDQFNNGNKNTNTTYIDDHCRDGEITIVNVKAKPDFIAFVNQTKGYAPAYHMNKKHWLTVLLDGSLPFEQVLERIDESFELINNTPTRRIYEAVKQIPRGKVATYGQVAAMAGEPKMARAVGNALHKNPDPDSIPCYRVVNAKGELAGEFAFGGEGAQARLLIADGIEVVNGKVDLKKYGIRI